MKITQDEIFHLIDGNSDRMYEYDGQQYPSVTTIIGSTLDKPALTPWAYKTGVEGAIYAIQREVSLHGKLSTLQDWVGSLSYDSLKGDIAAYGKDIESKKTEGGDRGLAVHEWVQAYANDILTSVEPEHQRYIDSLERWLEDYEPQFISTEQKIIHPGLGYAGTFDALAVIGKHPPRKRHKDLTGKLCLIDFKTNNQGAVYADQHLPQVEAYAEAYTNAMGGEQIDERLVVGIGPMSNDKPKYQTTVSYATINIFTPLLEYYKQRETMRAANPNKRK